MGPQMLRALQCVADLEGQAEAYVWPHTLESDFEAGLINRTTAARLANASLLEPLAPGQPLRLTDEGRLIARLFAPGPTASYVRRSERRPSRDATFKQSWDDAL